MKLMRYITLALFVGAIAVSTSISGFAQGRNINSRQRHQEVRIRQGIRSGELTRREAARLEAREGRIRAQEYRYRTSGGSFTPRERAKIQHRLNHTSRDIYRQKHDRQNR